MLNEQNLKGKERRIPHVFNMEPSLNTKIKLYAKGKGITRPDALDELVRIGLKEQDAA